MHTKSNALLIASAPDLLEALKGIEWLYALNPAKLNIDEDLWEETFGKVHKAIAKAEGEND